MTAKSNYVAGGVTILLAIVGAFAAERYSANRHGVVADATTDARYAFAAAPTYAADVEVEAKSENPAPVHSVDSFPDEARPEATEREVSTVTAFVDEVGSSVPPAVPVNGGTASSVGAVENVVVAAPEQSVAARLPLRCDTAPIADPQDGRCGWYKVQAGDHYYAGAVDGWRAVEPGKWHLAVGQVIYHTTLLPCSDPRIVWATTASGDEWSSASGAWVKQPKRTFPNTACIEAEVTGSPTTPPLPPPHPIRWHNLVPDELTPMALMSWHDYIARRAK